MHEAVTRACPFMWGPDGICDISNDGRGGGGARPRTFRRPSNLQISKCHTPETQHKNLHKNSASAGKRLSCKCCATCFPRVCPQSGKAKHRPTQSCFIRRAVSGCATAPPPPSPPPRAAFPKRNDLPFNVLFPGGYFSCQELKMSCLRAACGGNEGLAHDIEHLCRLVTPFCSRLRPALLRFDMVLDVAAAGPNPLGAACMWVARMHSLVQARDPLFIVGFADSGRACALRARAALHWGAFPSSAGFGCRCCCRRWRWYS